MFEMSPNSFTNTSFSALYAFSRLNLHLILQLIQYIEQPSTIPLDSQLLTYSLHQKGINMRYLGKIVQLIDEKFASEECLKVFKKLCLQEMMTRAVKHVMREYLRSSPHYLAASVVAHVLNCLYDKEAKKITEKSLISAISADAEVKFTDLTGSSLHARLAKEIRARFRIDMNDSISDILSVRAIPLLAAICRQVGIQVRIRDYKFAKGDFTSDDILSLYPIVKTAVPKVSFAEDALDHGRSLMMQGKKDVAVELMGESVSIYEQSVGAIHPDTARAYAQLALIYQQIGDVDSARRLMTKSVIVFERTRGFDSIETIQQYVRSFYFLSTFADCHRSTSHCLRAIVETPMPRCISWSMPWNMWTSRLLMATTPTRPRSWYVQSLVSKLV